MGDTGFEPVTSTVWRCPGLLSRYIIV